MYRIMQALAGLTKFQIILISCLLMVPLGMIDYITGPEYAFPIFYLLPIMLSAWFVNRRSAIYLAFFSTLVCLIADTSSRRGYLPPFIPYWNAIVRLGFFLIVAYILAELRKSNDRATERAQTDYLTGVANSRYFYEVANNELNRARRHNRPLTVAYIDIDNFKLVNDQWGHSAGDLLLKKVAETIHSNIRVIDSIARIGGDEFIILFPETGPDTANYVINRIQKGLVEIFQENQRPITLSIGVLTCVKLPDSADALVSFADRVMYSVKTAGKNAVKYEILEGEPA
jgi:diguanylate cyclase (GGDEF)-like protein